MLEIWFCILYLVLLPLISQAVNVKLLAVFSSPSAQLASSDFAGSRTEREFVCAFLNQGGGGSRGLIKQMQVCRRSVFQVWMC